MTATVYGVRRSVILDVTPDAGCTALWRCGQSRKNRLLHKGPALRQCSGQDCDLSNSLESLKWHFEDREVRGYTLRQR